MARTQAVATRLANGSARQAEEARHPRSPGSGGPPDVSYRPLLDQCKGSQVAQPVAGRKRRHFGDQRQTCATNAAT